MYELKNDINFDYIYELNCIAEKKKSCFVKQFEEIYDTYLKHKGLEAVISIMRWNEKNESSHQEKYDGYTIMLQLDIFCQKRYIKILEDNNYCSCFQNLAYIQWKPLNKYYVIYQNDNLDELWKDVHQMFVDINLYGFYAEEI